MSSGNAAWLLASAVPVLLTTVGLAFFYPDSIPSARCVTRWP